MRTGSSTRKRSARRPDLADRGATHPSRKRLGRDFDTRQSRRHSHAVSQQHAWSEAHRLHAPQPSISPPIIGLGVMILSFGLLFRIPLIVVGGAIFIIGIG